ncbi:MAG: oligosaccharide flippase family protein [Bacteroidaceae bacterium]|nr:oligosaccharide flippase family protein [Bacteroidaceae bacterium]
MLARKEQDDSYRHVLKYTGVFGGVQGLKMIVALVRNKLTAKLLGEAGMGLNKRLINVAEVLNAWTNFGISFYAVRRISELYEEGTEDDMSRFVSVIRTWSIWSALLGMFVCFFFASWLNDYYFPAGQDHTLEIMLLSLFVGSMPVEAVECALLKGLRRLRTVAFIEMLGALSTFLFTVPVYFLLGIRGVAVSLVLCGWAAALIHLYFSVRVYPYQVRLFSYSAIREGWPLIRIGVPYVLAGVAGAMATGEVFKSLGDNAMVGLYSAGYGLMVTYAGMVFNALENDFFPRLSSVNHDTARMNHAINQQIDVCVQLIAPVMIVFILAMPWLLRLLYSSAFLPALPMAVCSAFYMFFRAVTTPIAYTSLAKGDSWIYLIMECIYDVVFVLLLSLGYARLGLAGAGLALSAVALFDLLLIGSAYAWHYHFRLRWRTCRLILLHGLFLAVAVAACYWLGGWQKFAVGIPCLLLSCWLTFRSLSAELPIVQRLKKRLGL